MGEKEGKEGLIVRLVWREVCERGLHVDESNGKKKTKSKRVGKIDKTEVICVCIRMFVRKTSKKDLIEILYNMYQFLPTGT